VSVETTPWTLDTLPGDTIITIQLLISGDDVGTLRRSVARAAGHDDEKQLADLLRRLAGEMVNRAERHGRAARSNQSALQPEGIR
jgi:hypothetical protein